MKNITTGTQFRWIVCFASIVFFAASGCQTKPTTPPTESARPGNYSYSAGAPAVAATGDENIGFGVPLTQEPVQKLVNVGYTVGYSAKTRTPLWVSYRLF